MISPSAAGSASFITAPLSTPGFAADYYERCCCDTFTTPLLRQARSHARKTRATRRHAAHGLSISPTLLLRRHLPARGRRAKMPPPHSLFVGLSRHAHALLFPSTACHMQLGMPRAISEAPPRSRERELAPWVYRGASAISLLYIADYA